MKRLRNILLIILLLALIGGGVYFYLDHKKPAEVEVQPARVSDIRSMVQLCAVEIYNEVPVKDTVNNKMIFAIQKQEGSISFDIEKLQVDTVGDTIRVVLPPEIVEVRESTSPDSWEVVDTKGLNLFTSSKLSVDEENQVKRKLQATARARLYKDGVVKRAREEASENLKRLLEQAYRKPVVVS